MPDFRRKNIRLPAARYRGRQWYFVTACCTERTPFFADAALATSLIETLRGVALERNFAVHAYCVMPDHVHLLICGMREESDLLLFVRELKHRTGQAAWRSGRPHLWQKKFYDHILRRSEAVSSVASYIWMNPVRRGLCARPDEYPLSGSFTLDWERVRQRAAHLDRPWVPPWK
jgi:putative transposase